MAIINFSVFFGYLLPGVNFSDWLLAVYRGQTSIAIACFSIFLNFLSIVLGIAALFSLGEIVDNTGCPVESRWAHVYLAVITITTVGYGNILPSGVWSEFVAVIASLLGSIGFALLSGVFASVFYSKIIEHDKEK